MITYTYLSLKLIYWLLLCFGRLLSNCNKIEMILSLRAANTVDLRLFQAELVSRSARPRAWAEAVPYRDTGHCA